MRTKKLLLCAILDSSLFFCQLNNGFFVIYCYLRSRN